MEFTLGIQCPDNGVPVYGTFDEKNGKCSFELEDEEYAAQFCDADTIAEAQRWCDAINSMTFSDVDEANHHLKLLGSSEIF
ncbi:hypothetical protein KIH86_02910 [Paenibacillus sp. HN-1]|nr:hypothetical protein [Paenibacillus sp. CGMCC 1.18879]MBY9080970.1 hypothetical protein [Paenibacillus sp. CGMCC 1.18879]MBY9083182.1 hypothetical protein [Paenibacillus sinensis]